MKKICPNCEKEFETEKTNKKFCLETCQRLFDNRQYARRRPPRNIKSTCQRCGKPIIGISTKRKYCETCRFQQPCVCRWCGKEFIGKTKRSNCCGSDECIALKEEHHRKLSRDHKTVLREQERNERRKAERKAKKQKHKNTTKELSRLTKKANKSGLSYGQAVAIDTLTESDNAFRSRLEAFKKREVTK